MVVLAATLTTVGALAIIFFLDGKLRLDLLDFATVMIINLQVSLFVTLFFVPAMLEKIGIENGKRKTPRLWLKRRVVVFSRKYLRVSALFALGTRSRTTRS